MQQRQREWKDVPCLEEMGSRHGFLPRIRAMLRRVEFIPLRVANWRDGGMSSAFWFMGRKHLQESDVSWDHEPRSAAFRPQTPQQVERARHLPKGVEVPALLRPEGRAPKFQFMESLALQVLDAYWV